ncbi:MAG TPA: hypothetical protein VGF56_16160 [Rhizomicrobium sp.]|jgi:hypothetical protein
MSDSGRNPGPDPAAPASTPAAGMARQAAAMAVQDAVAHMRHINAIAGLTLGAAQEMMLTDKALADQAQACIQTANAMMQEARANFVAVSVAAERLLGAATVS